MAKLDHTSSHHCLRRQGAHDDAILAGVRRSVARPLVSAAAGWRASVVVVLATRGWHVARELERVNRVLGAGPFPAKAVVIVHASAVGVLDKVQAAPIRLAPLPGLIDQLDWDEEGPLPE